MQKRMYGIEEKTKNMFAFEDTVSKLEALDKFVTNKQFKETESQLKDQIDDARKISKEFERYVTNATFDAYKESNSSSHADRDAKIKSLLQELTTVNESVDKTKVMID